MRIITVYNNAMSFPLNLLASLALVALACGWVCRK